jgi:hypothetical protein
MSEARVLIVQRRRIKQARKWVARLRKRGSLTVDQRKVYKRVSREADEVSMDLNVQAEATKISKAREAAESAGYFREWHSMYAGEGWAESYIDLVDYEAMRRQGFEEGFNRLWTLKWENVPWKTPKPGGDWNPARNRADWVRKQSGY